jgi:hypothetical protein
MAALNSISVHKYGWPDIGIFQISGIQISDFDCSWFQLKLTIGIQWGSEIRTNPDFGWSLLTRTGCPNIDHPLFFILYYGAIYMNRLYKFFLYEHVITQQIEYKIFCSTC